MTFDISKVKIGDTVTARFEDEVDYIQVDSIYPYVSTTSGVEFLAEGNPHFADLKFTTPKVPLPTAPGSVISAQGVHWMLSNDRRWIGQSGVVYSFFDTSTPDYVIKYDAGADNG